MLCGRDSHIPKGVYCLLVLDWLKFTRFQGTKTSANKRFYNMSAKSIRLCACKGSELFWIEQEKTHFDAIFLV